MITIDDGEVVEREYLNEMAKYEPCRYGCRVLREKGDCSYLYYMELKEEAAQRKISSWFPREYKLRKLMKIMEKEEEA